MCPGDGLLGESLPFSAISQSVFGIRLSTSFTRLSTIVCARENPSATNPTQLQARSGRNSRGRIPLSAAILAGL